MVGVLGPLIQAGASLLGGLMGGEEESKTKQKSRTHTTGSSTSTTKSHLGQMVRAAERNGFNPLTVLRAGGLGAFSTTTGSTNSWSYTKSKGKGSSSSSSPMAAGIAAAGQAIGGAISNEPSAVAINAASAWQNAPTAGANANQAEYDALRSQLQKVQPGDLGTQPRVPVSQIKNVPAAALDGKTMPEIKAADVTDPYAADIPLYPDPLTPDGGTRYESEIAETIKDAHTFYRDMKYSLQKWNEGAQEIQKQKAAQGLTGPAVDAAADELIGNPLGGNIWDPPAIKMYVPPVVQKKSHAELYYKAPY